MDECSICLDFIDNCKDILILNCGHKYHYNCIKNVTNNLCPYCRDIIIKKNVCNQQHRASYFYVSYIKKNGLCRVCNIKTYNSELKYLYESQQKEYSKNNEKVINDIIIYPKIDKKKISKIFNI